MKKPLHRSLRRGSKKSPLDSPGPNSEYSAVPSGSEIPQESPISGSLPDAEAPILGSLPDAGDVRRSPQEYPFPSSFRDVQERESPIGSASETSGVSPFSRSHPVRSVSDNPVASGFSGSLPLRSVSEIPETSPSPGAIRGEREESLGLGKFPELGIDSPAHSHMSVDSMNPYEADPDSPISDTDYESNLRNPPNPDPSCEILCIGFSTLPLVSLIELLHTTHVSYIIDVRSLPVSESNPQFNFERLESSFQLKHANIEYVWLGANLGGRREYMEGVIRHGEMRIPDLKNYAAFMATPEFKAGLAEVTHLAVSQAAKRKRVLIMCEEALHWRCHRRMIADRLVANNWIVEHIGFPIGQSVRHVLWDIARIDSDGEIVYDVPRLVN
ncbi:hypothetical protein ACLOAV_010086 [Pseudogymnoascus australis]